MKKIRVGITGAAGQVGSVIVSKLCSNPQFETIAICRNLLSVGIIDTAAKNCDIRIGSITRTDEAVKLMHDCNVVINCALAMIPARPRESRLQNQTIIDNLIGLPKLSALIHMSSISVYGSSIDTARYGPKNNAFSNPKPDNDYGRSKLFIERHLAKRAKKRKLNYYLLRLGHVIGANMDRSKAILDDSKNPDFRLPFDGKLPSNTIRVKRLAAMMEPLIREEVPYGTYDVAEQSQSWRKVFNWHTQSTGFPEVKGMDEISSRLLKTAYRSRSIARDLMGWISSLPVLELVYAPCLFEVMFRALAISPKSVTESLAKFYKRVDTKRKLSQATARFDSRPIAPAYYSDAMPGRSLENEIYADYDLQADDAMELRAWHHMHTHIKWLPESIPEILSLGSAVRRCSASSAVRYPPSTWD